MVKKAIFKSALSIFILTFIGKIVGFVKSILIAAIFGANSTTDAYYLANGITSDVFYAITMSVSIAFLPIYLRVKETDGEQEGKAFAGRVLTNMSILSVLVTSIVIAVAPIVIKITASEYSGKQFQNAVLFLRIMAFGILFSLVADIMQNIMNAEEMYGYASLSAIINSIVLIVIIICFGKRCGMIALVVATPLAYLLQYAFLRIRSRRYVTFAFKHGIKDDNFVVLCKQAMPIFFSNATIEINQLIDRMILVSIADGAVTALSYSAVLFQFAAHVLSMPISTVCYTKISQACTKKDTVRVEKLLRQALKMIFLVGIPVAVVIFIVPEVIVRIVYGRGAYSGTAILYTTNGLKYYAFCLIPYCIKQVFSKAFYSMGDMKTPMKVGVFEVCVNIVASVLLARFFGVEGVVMGTAVASLIFSNVLIFLFNKKYVSLNLKHELKEIERFLIALCATLPVGYFLKNCDIIKNNIVFFAVFTCILFLIYGSILVLTKEDIIWDFIRGYRAKCSTESEE